jgi:hypothetical protein
MVCFNSCSQSPELGAAETYEASVCSQGLQAGACPRTRSTTLAKLLLSKLDELHSECMSITRDAGKSGNKACCFY